MPVQIRQVARLPEVLDAERFDSMSAHSAEPRQRRGVTVDDRDEVRIIGEWLEQRLNPRARGRLLARAVAGLPAGVQSIGGGHGEQPGTGELGGEFLVRRDGFLRDDS